MVEATQRNGIKPILLRDGVAGVLAILMTLYLAVPEERDS